MSPCAAPRTAAIWVRTLAQSISACSDFSSAATWPPRRRTRARSLRRCCVTCAMGADHIPSGGMADHHCRDPQFDAGNPLAERGIRRALMLTAVMMVVEIAGGWWFNSMAVLADGWHMSSHTVALGLSAFAFSFARRQARHRRYAFGTWKVEVLGGYTSALILLGVAALMTYQSVER